ncbi:MAG TPA: hypothetical protein VM661_05665 [Candidatus Sulfotelmatobacter sp.]|jgi:hypothetical protein|nr:hypothetical protein [Candidatus Sulfotelmatobacter sp.]
MALNTGADINNPAIEGGRSLVGLPESASLSCSDILKTDGLGRSNYDMVVSLSCADWSVETRAIIDRCWDLVAPGGGGRFVISLRLTLG